MIYDILACPSCKTKLEQDGKNLYCGSCDKEYGNGKILNLFPVVKNPVDYVKESGLNVVDVEFNNLVIKRSDVAEIVNAAYNEDLRAADSTIKKIWQEKTKGIILPSTVPDIVGVFEQVYRQYSELLPKEKRPSLNSIVTLARYAGEVGAGSYIGSFVLPEEVLKELPAGARYLEVAMGPGDNVRAVTERLNPEIVIGCDFSEEMVSKAIANALEQEVYLRADAQNLPFTKESFDVGIITNALDRIPKTKQALEELANASGEKIVVAQCMPFQNSKMVEGDFEIVYVPEDQAVQSIEEAIEKAGFKLNKVFGPVSWEITTIMDGPETLDVMVGIGER